MKKFNLTAFIEKTAGAATGTFNAVTAARLGLESFDIKTAAQLIGSAVYVKRAEYKKIASGLEALKKCL